MRHMRTHKSYLRRYPLSHFVVAVVITLSLIPVPEIPQLEDISLLDKWAHFLMYGSTCLVIWWEYLRQHTALSWPRLVVGAMLLPATLGGLLELAQKYLTTCRSGDILDFVANCIGVALAAILALAFIRLRKHF